MNRPIILLAGVTIACLHLNACDSADSAAAATTSATNTTSTSGTTTGSTTGSTTTGSTTTGSTGGTGSTTTGSTTTGSTTTGSSTSGSSTSGSTTTTGSTGTGSTGTGSTGSGSSSGSSGSGSGGSSGSGSGSSSGGSSTTTSVSTNAVSGTISGGAGVSVKLLAATTQSTTTDSSGNYSFSAVANGEYTLVPSAAATIFNPVSVVQTVNGATVSGIDFTALSTNSPTYNISGTVSGTVAAGVVVTLNGANVGSVATDQSGNYTFAGLAKGTYTVAASLAGDSFTEGQTITLSTTDSTAIDFTASASPGEGTLTFTALASLPQATVGASYSNTVINGVAGGTGPYHYQTDVLATGTPPLGMILKPDGTLSGTPSATGKYTFNVCAIDAAGDVTSPCAATSITVVAAPPVTPSPPVTPNYWVYQNGVFAWPGSFSYAATIDYTDTSGEPASGSEDIKVTLTSQWGAWQPYAQNFAFDSTPYTKLTFALKPTKANQAWQVYFMKIGDVPTGLNINVANYGPAPVVGQWATYTIPLADLGVLGTSIYKFAIQDESGDASNTWYVDNVGFAP